MSEKHIGEVVQVTGPVLDIRFPEGELPALLNAIEIDNHGEKLVVEVAQQTGDNMVRCIAMKSTDGLVRGMEAIATGKPISVPVGENTLGRIFNVLGAPIDNKPAPEGVSYEPIHRAAPEFVEQSTQQELLETGIKVVDQYIKYVACGIINLVNALQPEIICVGGGICNEGETLLRPLRRYIEAERYSVYSKIQTKILKAELGNDAGIIGAAILGVAD